MQNDCMCVYRETQKEYTQEKELLMIDNFFRGYFFRVEILNVPFLSFFHLYLFYMFSCSTEEQGINK